MAAGTATKQKHRQRRSEKRTGKNTWEEGAEVDHGVEDLPSVDLVGAEACIPGGGGGSEEEEEEKTARGCGRPRRKRGGGARGSGRTARERSAEKEKPPSICRRMYVTGAADGAEGDCRCMWDGTSRTFDDVMLLIWRPGNNFVCSPHHFAYFKVSFCLLFIFCLVNGE